MKQKILNALKTNYANLGLGDKAFDGVASFLEKTITDEANIQSAVSGDDVKFLLKSIQGETDTLRTKVQLSDKALREYREAHPEKPSTPEDNKEDFSAMMELLQSIRGENAALKARLDETDAKRRTNEMTGAVRDALKSGNRNVDALLDIVLGNIAINDGDTVESLTERYKGEYDTKYKALYGGGAVPPAGGFFAGLPDDDKDEFAGAVARLRSQGVLPNKQ